mmetsp:Transcript_14459/g.34878  ORF Transcript_14459/g.34878 Transcript_14459/m.34878 type:complete len:224 (-) Transcript_14459:272-943(-)
MVPFRRRSGHRLSYWNSSPTFSTGWSPTTPWPATSSTCPSSSWMCHCRDTSCTASFAPSFLITTWYAYRKRDSLGEDSSGTSTEVTVTRMPSVSVSLLLSAAIPSSRLRRRFISDSAARLSSSLLLICSVCGACPGSSAAPSRNSAPIRRFSAWRASSPGAILYPGSSPRSVRHSPSGNTSRVPWRSSCVSRRRVPRSRPRKATRARDRDAIFNLPGFVFFQN